MGLYQTWQHTLQRHHHTIAVHPTDTAPLRFGDLQQLLDKQSPLPPRHIHPVTTAHGPLPFLIQTLRAWRDHAILCPIETTPPPLPPAAEIPPHIVHIKHTSGTTGTPRCILFRAEQLIADAENIRQTMGLHPAHPNLAVISLAHSYGFSSLVLPLLLQGHPLVIAADVLPASLLRAAADKPPLTLPAVPAMWRAWHRAGILNKLPIHLAITAGAPMPLELEQAIHRDHGIKVHNFLGSSECGAIAYDPTETPRTDPTYVGQPARNVYLTLAPDGCLKVHSPAVAETYLPPSPNLTQTPLQNPAIPATHLPTSENLPPSPLASPPTQEIPSPTSQNLPPIPQNPSSIPPLNTQGTFHTTDLAELRAHSVHLLGRASDTINLAGRKLDPTEIETLLLQHPDIQHCLVLGIPSRDPTRCEETLAIINAPPALTQAQLTQWLGTQLPPWKRPRHYWFTQDLTPNSRGKTPRPHWREKYLSQRPHPTH